MLRPTNPNSFYLKYSPSLKAFFTLTSAHPYTVLRCALRKLKQQGTPLFKGATPSGSIVGRFGMGFGGDPQRAYTLRSDNLIIHWPTLLQDIPHFINEGLPEMTAFVWQFADILSYKSPLAYELLQRQIIQNLSVFVLEPPEVLPLDAEEMNILRRITKETILHPKMCESFKEAFKLTWGDLVEDNSAALKWAVDSTAYSANEISMLKLRDFKIKSVRERKVKIKTSLLSGNCFPKHANPLLQELYAANNLQSIKYGAMSVSNPDRDSAPRCLLINLSEYMKYRNLHTTAFVNSVPNPNNEVIIHPEYYASNVQRLIFDRYPHIIYSSGAVIFKEKVKELWPAHNIDAIVYINLDEFYESANIAYRTDRARSMRKSKPSVTRGEPRIITLSSPPCPEVEDKIYAVRVIKKGKYVYMHPEWPITSDILEDSSKKYTNTIHVKSIDALFFRADRLTQVITKELRASTTLREWIAYISTLGIHDIKLIHKRAKMQTRIDTGINRNPNFSREEIEAVRTMVRPRMTNADKAELIKICRGRTWAKIMVKAAQIRKEMVADGIKDMNKIPHMNYNVKLRKEIKANEPTGYTV